MNRAAQLSSRTFLFRKPIENKLSMKLSFSVFAVSAVGASAWLQPTTTTHGMSRSEMRRQYSKGVITQFSGSALGSTCTPEEVTTVSALTATGKPIAEGTLVSFFRGGLVAIRVDDDDIQLPAESFDVMEATDSIAKTSKTADLSGDLIGRQVVFSNGQVGVVVTHRPPLAFVYTDMNELEDAEGQVTVLDSLAAVEVSGDVRKSDCFGRVEGRMSTTGESIKRPIFAPIPQVKDIALINTPLVTGVTMFDALAPIGNGQNMLMVGHDIDDMRRYVCDILSVQKDRTKCFYACTDDTEQVSKLLNDAGLVDDVVLVRENDKEGVDAASKAAEATVIAATACAMAESFALEKGMDTFVIIDSIDQHKKLWDTTTRVLVDVFGADSVVKGEREGGASSEMRAFFSSLIQRSAQYNSKRGGGSVTLLLLSTIPVMTESDGDAVFSPEDFVGTPAKVQERINWLVEKKVPLTAANLRKIQLPIPSDMEGRRRLALQHIDDLISMSDGQIWLDEELAKAGQHPAMNFQRSITRIGIGADTESRADAAAMRRVVEGLRLDLSQALDMDAADVGTNASKKQIRNASAWLLAMHQPSSSGSRSLSESCVALLAASGGHLNDNVDNGNVAGTAEGEKLMKRLLEHVNLEAPTAMSEIDSSQDLTDITRESIEDAIKSFFS